MFCSPSLQSWALVIRFLPAILDLTESVVLRSLSGLAVFGLQESVIESSPELCGSPLGVAALGSQGFLPKALILLHREFGTSLGLAVFGSLLGVVVLRSQKGVP